MKTVHDIKFCRENKVSLFFVSSLYANIFELFSRAVPIEKEKKVKTTLLSSCCLHQQCITGIQTCFNDAKLPVVKEKFLLWFNVVFGKYSNPVITSNDHDFSITVWVNGMIGKAYLVTLSCGINYII